MNKRSIAHKKRMEDPEKKKEIIQRFLPSRNNPEVQEKRIKALREACLRPHWKECRKETSRAHGERCALKGELRSPTNQVHQFNNLRRFVEENPNLFDPDDVKWIKREERGVWCRAYVGLGALFGKSSPKGSWKGWTRVSHFERIVNDGQDVLQRPTERDPVFTYTIDNQ